MDSNLIIDDDYVLRLGAECQRQGKAVEDLLNRYLRVMAMISSEAVPDGEIHRATVEFVNQAGRLSGKVGEASQLVSKICSSFIAQVDGDDQFLY
ncbi:hypothetical protein KIM372_06300 [Bombiscardovia nodaiensis]|uniref:Uncharacterized protein n=1 Tax=Bombiscardovia nodaiensis TaxID=2932181 RepID=A0ABM8B7A4_9BIFI|nr:hypothetical protein KIM372_06300 [Bombiscardovia nodaiensis]